MDKLTDKTLDHVAYRFKLMGEPMRLKLLSLLKDGEMCVQDLVRDSGAGQANVSKHMALLTSNGIVGRRKDGLHVYYYIADHTIFTLCDIVCDGISNNVETLGKAFSK
jgi:DNA-binding transcriptional ArsR family regulator